MSVRAPQCTFLDLLIAVMICVLRPQRESVRGAADAPLTEMLQILVSVCAREQ